MRILLPHCMHCGRSWFEDCESIQPVPAAGEPTISMTALLELLKNADPEVKAQLRLALLT